MAIPPLADRRSPDDDGPARLIVIGASAGGIEALSRLIGALPASLDAAVCVVLHTSPHGQGGRLATVLGRQAAVSVRHPEDGDALVRGVVYVAPPDHHLIVEEGIVRLTRGPRENRQRPAVDALFRSAAYVYADRAIGVVLTGALDDGTAGLWTIKDRGGIAIVQEPADAVFPSMPASAIEYVDVDHVVPLAEVAPLLLRLTGAPTSPQVEVPVSKELEITSRITRGGNALEEGVLELGPTTPFTCPDCAGVLVRVREGGVPAFRCHTGHAFSFDTLMAATTDHTEEIVWNALRGVEEMIMLLDLAAENARGRGDTATADTAGHRSTTAQHHAEALRAMLREHRALSQATSPSAPREMPLAHGPRPSA